MPWNSQASARSARISTALAYLSAILAATALGGWALAVPTLYRYADAFPAMTPETVLGVLLAAAAVVASNRRLRSPLRATAHGVAIPLSVALGAMALGTLLVYAVYGTDAVAARAFLPVELSSPRTSVAFLAMAAALVVASVSGRYLLHGLLLLIVPFFIAIVALTGYVLSASDLYGVNPVIGMAIPTSVSVLLLVSAAVLGPLRLAAGGLLLDESYGGVVVRRLLPISLFAPPVLTWLSWSGQNAGFYGEEMTVVLLVVVPCLILSGAVGALSFRLTKSVREIASERVAKEVLEAELELRERSEDELRQANRAKDEFLGVLSHELRSPLNVIIGYSQILEGLDPASDAHSRAVDAIRRNALAEARLVEDTLELSRIVSGKLVLKRAAFHLGETIREVVDAVRVTIDGKDLQLLAEIDAAVGACDGDEGRIRQVLSNILSNAVKFNTENGQIRLSARRVGRDYEIAVEDTGIGLERDELGRVFDHFWQADTGRTRRFEGLGIGLSLVRHLVDAHGGKVSAYSAGRNCGTTFVVTLPGPEDLAAGDDLTEGLD